MRKARLSKRTSSKNRSTYNKESLVSSRKNNCRVTDSFTMIIFESNDMQMFKKTYVLNTLHRNCYDKHCSQNYHYSITKVFQFKKEDKKPNRIDEKSLKRLVIN